MTCIGININGTSKAHWGGLGELQGITPLFAELNSMAPTGRTLLLPRNKINYE